MKKALATLFLVLLAASAFAERIVVPPGRSQAELDSLAAATGSRPGLFPALVDKDTGLWVPIEGGDLSAAESALAELAFDAAVAAKSPDQLALEAEYFALVEEIYAAAGEEAPDLETAKNLGQARAKIAKARQNKPGTGQGGKKTADDALEFLDMQMRLQGLDLELRGYDPDWRRLARKHVLE